jgi:hypothetical protein
MRLLILEDGFSHSMSTVRFGVRRTKSSRDYDTYRLWLARLRIRCSSKRIPDGQLDWNLLPVLVLVDSETHLGWRVSDGEEECREERR